MQKNMVGPIKEKTGSTALSGLEGKEKDRT
jgi:hypothetical protein